MIPENVHNPFDKKLNPNNVEEIAIDTDLVVFAAGVRPNNEMYLELLRNNKCKEVYCIGDSRKSASAWEAINDGNEIGRHI